MTEELRAEIPAVKHDVCTAPEYRKTLLSVHVYEAVLNCGVRGTEGFWEWWRGRIDPSEPAAPAAENAVDGGERPALLRPSQRP